mmetsp:Transcript_77915/g.252673  ORF Transcript_77915/g.252673 Transcript_77915/m.252673 type:complete len:223 (-) Transcript_77915:156-824(-)
MPCIGGNPPHGMVIPNCPRPGGAAPQGPRPMPIGGGGGGPPPMPPHCIGKPMPGGGAGPPPANMGAGAPNCAGGGPPCGTASGGGPDEGELGLTPRALPAISSCGASGARLQALPLPSPPPAGPPLLLPPSAAPTPAAPEKMADCSGKGARGALPPPPPRSLKKSPKGFGPPSSNPLFSMRSISARVRPGFMSSPVDSPNISRPTPTPFVIQAGLTLRSAPW